MLKLLAGILSATAMAQSLPFWKAKSKVYERIQNHEVIVSSSERDVSPNKPRYELKVLGGGQTRAPCDFVFKEAQKYEELAHLSSFISKAKYDADKKILAVTIDAFFRRADFEIGIHPGDKNTLDFVVLSGPTAGFHWLLAMSEVTPKACEISLDGLYKYDHYPMPHWFLEVGVETVFKHMAEQLRDHVENEWKIWKNPST